MKRPTARFRRRGLDAVNFLFAALLVFLPAYLFFSEVVPPHNWMAQLGQYAVFILGCIPLYIAALYFFVPVLAIHADRLDIQVGLMPRFHSIWARNIHQITYDPYMRELRIMLHDGRLEILPLRQLSQTNQRRIIRLLTGWNSATPVPVPPILQTAI